MIIMKEILEEQMNQKRNGIKDVLYLNKLDIEK